MLLDSCYILHGFREFKVHDVKRIRAIFAPSISYVRCMFNVAVAHVTRLNVIILLRDIV